MLTGIQDLTNEIITDPQTHAVIQCSWCEKYYDKETKKYVPNPKRICGHGICKKCMDDAMNELEEYQR